MALFKISKGLSKNLMTNVPYAKEGFAYFTSDDGKFYIDINGDGTNASPAVIGENRIPLSALSTDWIKATKIEDAEAYPILAFRMADSTKNLIELKYGSIGYKDGTLVIPNVETGNKDEVLIENNDEGSALIIDNKGAGTGIKIINTGEDSLATNQGINIDNNILLNMNGSASFNGPVTMGGTSIFVGGPANVLGTNKTNTIISNQLTLQQGAVFGGSARNAGLVTRGICGISVPTDDGTCEKDNLYINYDGYNSYKASRHVILQAGEAGENYGNHLYQYAAARGDAVHDWSLNNFYKKSDIDNKLNNLLATNDAMVFKGTIGGDAAATIHELPAKHSAGETYRVYDIKGGNNGKYLGNGEVCEIGDLIICIKDGTTHSAGDWTIVQTNIDGAVIGPNTSTINAVPTFADETGKVIKNNPAVTIDETGLFTAPYIATGDGEANYFQSRKFRGEGNANTYYHAVDFGYAEHNQVDFHEYGGTWNFYKNTQGTAAGGQLVASIKPDGFHGNLKGNADTATKFASAQSITLTGDITGTASSQAGWSITTTLSNSGVTSGIYGPTGNVNGTNGATISVPQITVDAKGRVTSIVNRTYTSVNTDTNTTYSAGAGLTLSGTQFKHSNSITAGSVGTAQSPSHGGTFAIPKITYDAQGHITGATTVNITLPADNNTDTKVTTAAQTSSKIYVTGTPSIETATGTLQYNANVYISGNVMYGACWNDYAEYRISNCQEPGRVICENGDDTLSLSTERLQSAGNVISDTFGFAIGETEQAKTPVAVSGRVLAYPYESREEFKKNIGRPVCSGPNGTVSIMTDKEYRDKGYCAIGTISAVPEYETWGEGNIPVNGRVWIKVF